uniref:Uncharacterized protein n=1 Tax=Arundo donax TaxID=35708 RepID=A0A0A8ZVU8_ARUDO
MPLNSSPGLRMLELDNVLTLIL